MTIPHSCIKRILLAGGLILGVLATAALSGPAARADAPKPAASRTPTPAPASATPTAAPGFAGPLPQMTAVEVRALGTEATLSFITTQPSAVTIDYQPAGGPTAGGQSPVQGYATTHERRLAGLRSNTTYDVTVTATTKSGEKHTAQTRFTTSKQRVRITLREINITEDGDGFLSGDGEPSWLTRLEWAGGKTGGCYPNNGAFCETGSYGEGRIFPRNYLGQFLSWTFAEENFDRMPAAFTLSVKGEEYDIVPVLGKVVDLFQPASGFESGSFAWQVPAGQEWASTPAFLDAGNGSQGFKSTMAFTFELFHDNLSYPSARNMPQSTWAR